MVLHYMGHSGMLVRSQTADLLFDYYLTTSDGPGLAHGLVDDAVLCAQKPLYVFISHSHGDHMNPIVFTYIDGGRDVRYIVAGEAEHKVPSHLLNRTVVLQPGMEYRDEHLLIRAYGSTDLGVSYYVEHEDKRIFHAGDLNDWHWQEEVPAEEARGYTDAYLRELAIIKGGVDGLDLAMFPVDGRLGKGCYTGAEAFLKAIPTSVLAPMHFGDNYKSQDALIARGPFGGTRIIRWNRRGETREF